MAKFDAKTFNPEAFGKYMSAIPNVKLNKLRSSRAIVRDNRLVETFKNNSQTGSVYATLPYFGLLSGEAQNYDGVTNLTPGSTKTFEQGVFTYGRMMGWTEADFSYDVTGGVDFMANVRAQVQEYWNGVDQDVMLAILKGIFSMTGSSGIAKKNKDFVTKHTYDIGSKDEKTTEAHLVNATTLNNAIQQACGDNKTKFSLALMHSAVATNLENLNLLSYLKYTDASGVQRDLELGTWNGRLVIVDDSMPTETKSVGSTGGSQTLYTTYLLGDGAIGFEPVGAKVPYETDRDPKVNGGEDTLYSRQRKIFAPYGISFTDQSIISPTDEQLETGSKWSLANSNEASKEYFPHKAIPIARVITRG